MKSVLMYLFVLLFKLMLVKLALDVIQGCEYLHSRNVIHGNLAARNILIEKQRGKGINLTHYNAKVSDHGITQLFKVKEAGRNYVKVRLVYKFNIVIHFCEV